MTKSILRGARAAVVCYAVNDEESWNKMKFWISELRKVEDNCLIYICATKIDLLGGNNKKRAIDYHNTTDYSDEIGAKLFETSSKSGTNIVEMFQQIAKDFLEREDESGVLSDFNEAKLAESSSKSACCGGRSES